MRISLVAAAVGLSLAKAALAQNVESRVSSGESVVEEIVVTGSLITRDGFTAPTPVTVMSTEDLRLSGATNVGQLAFQFPQLVPNKSALSSSSATSPGGTYFNLRGLGDNRSLTLVNGRRPVPTTNTEVFDNSVIPAGAIERVEIVTGGASAAYGTDAVAGVVNIILRQDIEGLETSVQGGETFRGDGRELRATVNWGTRFAKDRGRFMIATEVSDNEGILTHGSRDWAKHNWGMVTNPNYAPGNGEYNRIITRNAGLGNATAGGLILNGPLAGTQFLPGGVPARFDAGAYPFGSSLSIGEGLFNNGYDSTLLVPLKRRNVYSRLGYDLTENMSAFLEATYSKVTGDNTRISLLETRATNALVIRQDNAFLPEELRALLPVGSTFRLARMNADFPRYKGFDDNVTRQITLGLEGQFGAGWSWSGHYTYGDNDIRKQTNDMNLRKVQEAVTAVRNNAGQIVCASTLVVPGNGCVPLNPFGLGSPSQAAIDYVVDDYAFWQKWTQNQAAFTLQGEPFSTWAGPVSVATGLSYHDREYQRINNQPEGLDSPHLLITYENVTAKYNVKEIFGETVLPLLADRPLARSLDLNAAVRVSDHSFSGEVTTWKAGLSYEPNDQVRLRVTRSRDIRSPNISEFAITPIHSFSAVRDLDGSVRTVQNNRPPNPNLDPEEADTWAVGVVYRPAWADGLSMSVDYYEIDLQGAIASLSAQQTIDGCALGNATLCGQLVRDGAGVLTQVTSGLFNASSRNVEGVDLELSYRLSANRLFSALSGDFTTRVIGSYTDHNTLTLLGTVTDIAGQASLGGVPTWSAIGHLGYSNERMTLRLGGRYISGGTYENRFSGYDININDFSGRFYLNAAAEYKMLESELGELELFGNIDNLLDRDPPIIPGQPSRNGPVISNYALYDPLGARFMVGARFKIR